jgi:RNA polymerase sigma factor (sigma-70 family)
MDIRMEFGSNIVLADANGQPLSERFQKVLRDLLPRLRRAFPNLRDEAVITNILEQAGQRISEREERYGTLAELHGYTWTTVKNAVISMQRGSDHMVQKASIRSAEADWMLAQLPAGSSDAASIEEAVLLSQALERLTAQEKQIAIWKKAGFSVEEIASHLNVSPGSVHQMYFRMRHRLRKMLNTGKHPE